MKCIVYKKERLPRQNTSKVQHFTLLRITFFFRLSFKCWPVLVNLWKHGDYTNNFNAISMWLEAAVLLFGLAGKDTTAKFQCVTELSLNVSDSFPKIISMCLERGRHKQPRILSLNS